VNRTIRLFALAGLLLAGSGCVGDLRQTIVATRNQQGDEAVAVANFADAAVAYRLALQLDPSDEHARTGLAEVQLRIADQLYKTSRFEEALAALEVAAKYDPQSVRLTALRSEIESAKVKREIVVANYPAYKETGFAIRRAYVLLKTQSARIVGTLQRFDYTYDSAALSKAIRDSYELNADVGRLTNRLTAYRHSVDSGALESGEEGSAAAGSLLPLP
jgi:tetratricopeptide (TPR) repeat protein